MVFPVIGYMEKVWHRGLVRRIVCVGTNDNMLVAVVGERMGLSSVCHMQLQ